METLKERFSRGRFMSILPAFNDNQILVVNKAVGTAEDIVSNHYKMSVGQWLQAQYDVRTLADLSGDEVIEGPFAQVIKYVGRRKNSLLSSSCFDYYRICIQDHAILSALEKSSRLELFPFSLYVIIHELVHIVRFSRFQHFFDATAPERIIEEKRVHECTRDILSDLKIVGIREVLSFYESWHSS